MYKFILFFLGGGVGKKDKKKVGDISGKKTFSNGSMGRIFIWKGYV